MNKYIGRSHNVPPPLARAVRLFTAVFTYFLLSMKFSFGLFGGAVCVDGGKIIGGRQRISIMFTRNDVE